MKIEKEYFLDKSEQDADGFYDYYYEGVIYIITFDDIVYAACCYTDSPDELSFFSVSGKMAYFKNIPYDEESFWECIKYFRNELNFREFSVLTTSDSGTYIPVQLNRIPGFE